MTPDDFVRAVRASVIDSNAEIYRKLLNSPPEAASDPYWRSLRDLHGRLGDADRAVLYEAMRQAAVDAVSNLFGVMDGSSRLEQQSEDVELWTAQSETRLDGSLQDLLLEAEETQAKR